MQLKRYPIATLSQLEEGESLLFEIEHDGSKVEGFLVNFEGDLFAYHNRCVHVPMRLDARDKNLFFDSGQKRFRCQSHHATFRPDTGECLQGPPGCPGQHLAFIALAVDGEEVFAVLPSKAPQDPATVR